MFTNNRLFTHNQYYFSFLRLNILRYTSQYVTHTGHVGNTQETKMCRKLNIYMYKVFLENYKNYFQL